MENAQINKVISRSVKLHHLDEKLYHELEGWGVFISCPISLEDCTKKEFLCAVLRMKDEMYAGCVIFQKEGEQAHFMHLEVIPCLRGSKLGELLFGQGLILLKAKGIRRIIANDTLNQRKNRYLCSLGFTAKMTASYMEYDYHTITNSLLYRQVINLEQINKNVKVGREISESAKTDFLRSLLRKGMNVSENLIYNPYSLFYTVEDKIYGYIGIRIQDENCICVMDNAILLEKSNGIDIRLPLFGKAMCFAKEHVKSEEYFKLIFFVEDLQTKNGMLYSIGVPNLQTDITIYELDL